MYYKVSEIKIEELNRQARLYVGLPVDYETSGKRYPVLYMHDGHNVFSDEDAFSGVSWGIIEAYEKYKTLPEIIVVGLECAEGFNRFDEYCPFDITFPAVMERTSHRKTGGRGNEYLKYMAEVLKPQIDSEFRTLKAAEYTGIMGSSMGGVISLYAALKYNNIFSRVGAVSGSYFVALNEMLKAAEGADMHNIKKLYMDTGSSESGVGNRLDYIEANTAVYEILKEKLGPEQLQFEIVQGGIHHESAWRKRLPDILSFLFNDLK